MMKITTTGEMSMPPEIGQHVPNWAQDRLCHPIEEVASHGDKLVSRVDDIESDQPRQHGRRDQQPDVQLQN